jgi:hypothetical protein
MRGQHIKSEAPTVIGGPPKAPQRVPPPEDGGDNATSPAVEAVERRVPKTSLGMDDLFASAGDAGRMRVRSRRSSSDDLSDSKED